MNVFLADEQDDPLDAEPLRRLAELVMVEEGLPDDTEVTLLFVGDEQIAEFNRRFMQREGPTDVLAFPLEHMVPGEPPQRSRGGPPLSLGDVVISPAYVRAQARQTGTSYDDEVALVVVHGLLHLLGYDHQDDEQAEAMELREQVLLARVGRNRP